MFYFCTRSEKCFFVMHCKHILKVNNASVICINGILLREHPKMCCHMALALAPDLLCKLDMKT